MAEIGEAWQNGYAERLIRTIKEEEVDLSDYECYTDAVFQLGRFLNDVYMHKRIHSSLGYLTPAEFEEQWRCRRRQALDVTRNASKSVQFVGSPHTDPLGALDCGLLVLALCRIRSACRHKGLWALCRVRSGVHKWPVDR